MSAGLTRVSVVSISGPGATVADLRKARGAFFTPPELCNYIARWAIQDAADIILEPACGEAAFMLAAGARLQALGGTAASDSLHGVELHADSAVAALGLLHSAGHDAAIRVCDFFDVSPEPRYDAVIGNPPYVRYQDFTGEPRARGRAAALRAGVPLTGLASSWAAFTVFASLFLKPQGRLGLVLPAELLTVNYAAEVRRYLMERFARVRLVLFTERVFPDVLEEIVLLLADGVGPTDHCELYQVQELADLRTTGGVGRQWRPERPEGKWTPSLLPPVALEAYAEMARHESFTTLESWGDTTLGMVTGNNRYFALSPARVRELGLSRRETIRLSPPGSTHLRGLSFSELAWRELGKADRPTLLFRPPDSMSAAATAYIEAGKKLKVDEAYKCRVRSPWWRVPLVPPADLLLTYMNADTPRLCANTAGVHHLNSVHGVYFKDGMAETGSDLLPLGALNSMTLLGAETVGRAYGGGILKLEPREADTLPVPALAVLQDAEKALTALRPQMAQALRNGQLLEAVRLVDDVLLTRHLGLSRAKVASLREAHDGLRHRRTARGANPRGPD